MSEKKRAVYLTELDWDLVVSCLEDHLPYEVACPGGAKTLWSAGAARARYIVEQIKRGKPVTV